MLEIAVCDDNQKFTIEFENQLWELGNLYGINLEIDTFKDGSQLVEAVEKGKRYDAICLDIQMAQMDGLQAAKRIRKKDRVVQLIYVTSYDSYMKDVFEVTPSGFITKPINQLELKETFKRIVAAINGQDEYYRFSFNKEHYKLRIRDILYFARNLRRTEIIGESACYHEYRKLKDIKDTLDQYKGKFLQIHKSYLVNYCHITKFSYESVTLSNGMQLPVSRSYRKEVDEEIKKLMSIIPR